MTMFIIWGHANLRFIILITRTWISAKSVGAPHRRKQTQKSPIVQNDLLSMLRSSFFLSLAKALMAVVKHARLGWRPQQHHWYFSVKLHVFPAHPNPRSTLNTLQPCVIAASSHLRAASLWPRFALVFCQWEPHRIHRISHVVGTPRYLANKAWSECEYTNEKILHYDIWYIHIISTTLEAPVPWEKVSSLVNHSVAMFVSP